MFRYGSALERLVDVAAQFLGAAIAIYLAVKLITAVWFSLLIIVLCVATLIGIVVLIRRRRQGW